MIGRASIWRAGCVALAAVAGHAAEDLDGAADPAGYERFPGSWIVAYTPPTTVRDYELVTGRVDRSGRTVRVDDSVRVSGEIVRVTYRAADGTRFEDVVRHYRAQVAASGADVAFTCRARDCGRSTSWANSVFGVKELVAPDSSQFYLAATSGTQLLAAYIVQRGNRRVYAHLDVGVTATAFGGDSETALARRLRESGYAVMPGVTPDETGVLDAADLRAVDAVAGQVEALAAQTLYVVCHVTGPDRPDAALARSATCAETVVARLRTAGVVAFGFGGGPLLPRSDAPPSRVELVMPGTRSGP